MLVMNLRPVNHKELLTLGLFLLRFTLRGKRKDERLRVKWPVK